jgi:hypothetical protein
MRVRIDAEHAPKVEGSLMPAPVQIQAGRMGVDLNGYPVPGASLQDLLDVNLMAPLH